MRADTDRVLETAGEAFGRSAVLAQLSHGLDRSLAAWQHSRTYDAAIALARAFSALPLDVRARLGGLSLLAFAATTFAAGLAIPAPVAPIYPGLFWMPAAVAGALLISQPQGWAAAWSVRRRRLASRGDQKKNA